jgi:hypothetical protein
VKHVRAGGRLGAFEEFLDDDERRRVLAEVLERARQAEFEFFALRREFEPGAVERLSLGPQPALEQQITHMPAKRDVVRRGSQRITQKIEVVGGIHRVLSRRLKEGTDNISCDALRRLRRGDSFIASGPGLGIIRTQFRTEPTP